MAKMSFIFTFFLVSLLFFSLSLPSSAHDHHHRAATLVPHSRVLLHEEGRLLSSAEPRKLKIFMKKRSSGTGTGIATRARGKTALAFRTSQISSFHFGSVFACSLLLGFLVL
ncbi:hypothetical protein Pint_14372 [Pistacia integerrima]|uniref:Uncharacterized protein n=1 Tax=Pistacia integerrima TaxID=434235 RepID=A0ACC0Y8T1_9ROSI|nr:hypothetical protein Pint_14372 [Pistacia integerrima]